MILEHEVIEQIEDETCGRSITWGCDLIRRLGRDDPLVILEAMLAAGFLRLVDDAGAELSAWRCAEVL